MGKFDPTTKVGAAIKMITDGTPELLTDEQRQFITNLNIVDDILRLYGPGKKAKALIQEKLDCAPSTAQRWIVDAQTFLGSTAMFEKNYWKTFAVDTLVRVISAARESFFIEKNGETTFKADGKELRALAALMKELRETIGYDKDDVELEEVKMPDVLILNTDISTLGLKPTGLTRDQIIDKFYKETTESDGED
jgi:hypothetical protein